MPIPFQQADILQKIAERHAEGTVLAVIPAYAGTWETAAHDAAQYAAASPNVRTLFVCEHSQTLGAFGTYIGRVAAGATVMDAEMVTQSTETFDYVAVTEEMWKQGLKDKYEASSSFVLRLARRVSEAGGAEDAIIVPRYSSTRFVDSRSADAPKWDLSDSTRYYTELYLEKGEAVSGGDIVRLTQEGAGPHKARFFQGGSMTTVREAAGLTKVVYHRGLTLMDQAKILRRIGRGMDHVPTAEEIKAALAATGGPDYVTLTKGTNLAELRMLAGQTEGEVPRVNRRAELLGEWTATDSADLYHALSRAAGHPLTSRELERALAMLPGKRRPTRSEFLAPFGDKQFGTYGAFGRMQQAAGYTPSRIYGGKLPPPAVEETTEE